MTGYDYNKVLSLTTAGLVPQLVDLVSILTIRLVWLLVNSLTASSFKRLRREFGSPRWLSFGLA